MRQSEQFSVDLHALTDCVRHVEARTFTTARWEHGSWGNDATRSWMKDDAGSVHAESFCYAPAYAGRFDRLFGDAPYLPLSIQLHEEIVTSCCATPGQLTRAARAVPAGSELSPADAVLGALDTDSALSIAWSAP
jgi:hypothetical protein